MHTRVIVPKPWYTGLQWGPYVKLRLKLVSPLKLLVFVGVIRRMRCN